MTRSTSAPSAALPARPASGRLDRVQPAGRSGLRGRPALVLRIALFLSVLPGLDSPAAAVEPATGELAQLVVLHAQVQEFVQEKTWRGSGGVQIRYQDISVKADEMDLDLQTLELRAFGNIVLDQGANRLACERIEFNLREKVGTLYQVSAFFAPTYYFRGEELEKLSETRYRFHRGTFTSCQTPEDGSPPWSIDVRDAVMELEGYGHFRGAAVRAKGIPVFYTPRLVWPVKRERAFGLLTPNFGHNSRRGSYFGTALFMPIGRSWDTTTYVDIYSKGYLGLGQEVRWAPAQNAKGDLVIDTVRDKDTGNWEWKLLGSHQQFFPGGYAVRAELNDLSDVDFFQQFERAFDRTAVRSLYSHVTVSRTWGPHSANLRTDRRKTFFSFGGAPSQLILQRQPELEYRLRSTRLGETPLYLSMVALANHFWVDRTETLRGNYSRTDVFPVLSVLTPGLPWLNVTPSVGFRHTYYTSTYSQDRRSFVDESLERTYATAGLSLVGPSFSRIFTSESSDLKVKHLIEPRLEYTYVSDPGDTTRIPVFDEKDSVLVANRVRWTLANRLFSKRGESPSREVASLEISQERSFSDPLTPARFSLEASRQGPLTVWFRASPAARSSVDARADFDPVTNNLRSTALSGGIFLGAVAGNVTWFSSYDPVSGDVSSSQARLFSAVGPPRGPWRLELQGAYDIHKQTLLEQRYILRWKGSCWSAYAEVRDYRISPYATRDYRISIDLTGLGTFIDLRGKFGDRSE